MRVLYILKRFPRLSETFVLNELLGLEAAGDEILVDGLLEPEDEPRHLELDQLRAQVRYLPRRPRLRHRSVRSAHARVALRAPIRWLRAALRAKRSDSWRRFVQAGLCADRIRVLGVEHVHAHFATAAAEVARDAAYLARVPVSVTAHAKDIYHADNAPMLARRLSGVDTVVTVSRCNVEHLRRALAPDVDIRHIPNGVSLAAMVGRPPNGPILCVSRLVPKKGIDVLVDAIALLAPMRPDITVEIIGGGPLLDELRGRAEALGLGPRIRFLGRQPSSVVADAYQRCSMVVLPCRIDADGDRDGLPTVLVEALARGLPVVSTDIVGIPELVRDGVTGLLTPPDDPAALAGAITRLLDDPSFARGLGMAGRALVSCDFDPARSLRALRAVFGREPVKVPA